MQKDIFKTPSVFLVIGRLHRHGVHTGASTFFLSCLWRYFPPPSGQICWVFFLTTCQKHTAYLIYCVQRSRICFFNTSSYLLPSIDLQILYYVPYSYSLFRDSSSCVGQMAQSVGCIRALKKKILSCCFYPDSFEFSEMQQL